MPTSLLKTKVAKCFGAASSSYDKSARLQRHSGFQLVDLIQTDLNHSNTQQKMVVDLGCGTGFFSDILAKTANKIIGIDISKDMLQYAKQHRSDRITWSAGDAHQLPLEDNSIDIMFSNLVIQWCDPLDVTFKEINRVLRPGGKVVFSTLLDGTLNELKQSWAVVDNDQHVIDFKTEEVVRNKIDQSMFDINHFNLEPVILPYSSVKDLALELKSLGANHLPNKQSKGLAGKSAWQAMCGAYKQYIDQAGHYPATYQLCTTMLTKKRKLHLA